MTTFVVATNSVHTSAAICDYLDARLGNDDEVHAVNSQIDRTDSRSLRDGEEALNVVRARLAGIAVVETRQFVRGNQPTEDVLSRCEAVGADEIVLGGPRRSATGSPSLGSVTRGVLANADRPAVTVPLE